MQFKLDQTPFGSPVAQLLRAELHAEYVRRYGGGDETSIEDADFDPPGGDFLVAFADGAAAAGCGGWRSAGDGDAEMKRVYVREDYRRRGLARLIVAAIEDSAARAGRKRVILETGPRQPEAIAMYAALGYAAVEPFGFYAREPGSVHLGKRLPGA